MKVFHPVVCEARLGSSWYPQVDVCPMYGVWGLRRTGCTSTVQQVYAPLAKSVVDFKDHLLELMLSIVYVPKRYGIERVSKEARCRDEIGVRPIFVVDVLLPHKDLKFSIEPSLVVPSCKVVASSDTKPPAPKILVRPSSNIASVRGYTTRYDWETALQIRVLEGVSFWEHARMLCLTREDPGFRILKCPIAHISRRIIRFGVVAKSASRS